MTVVAKRTVTVVSKASLQGLSAKDRVAKMQVQQHPAISVMPAKDEYRRTLKHPNAGGFPDSGAAMWPDDRFTRRRLADGSVMREGEEREAPDKKATPHRFTKSEDTSAA